MQIQVIHTDSEARLDGDFLKRVLVKHYTVETVIEIWPLCIIRLFLYWRMETILAGYARK